MVKGVVAASDAWACTAVARGNMLSHCCVVQLWTLFDAQDRAEFGVRRAAAAVAVKSLNTLKQLWTHDTVNIFQHT
jgi:hypothetical protein